jgi:hypothetical protein
MPGKNVTMIKNLVDEISDFAIEILRSALENNLLIETQLNGKRAIKNAHLDENP